MTLVMVGVSWFLPGRARRYQFAPEYTSVTAGREGHVEQQIIRHLKDGLDLVSKNSIGGLSKTRQCQIPLRHGLIWRVSE